MVRLIVIVVRLILTVGAHMIKLILIKVGHVDSVSDDRLIDQATGQLLDLLDGTAAVLDHSDKRQILFGINPEPGSGDTEPVIRTRRPRLA